MNPSPLADHEISDVLALGARADDGLESDRVVADPLKADRVAAGQEGRHPRAPGEPDPLEFGDGPGRARVGGRQVQVHSGGSQCHILLQRLGHSGGDIPTDFLDPYFHGAGQR